MTARESRRVEELRSAIRRQIDRELATRSRLGALTYCFVFAVSILVSPYGQDAPVFAYSAVTAMLVLGILRILLARAFDRIYPHHPRFWKRSFVLVQLGIAGLLAAFCIVALVLYGLDRTSLIIMVCVAGLTAGGTLTINPDRLLFRVWLGAILAPVAVALCLRGGADGYTFGFLFVVFFIFLTMAGHRLQVVYHDSLRDAILLERRNQELESEVLRRIETESALRSSEDRISKVLHATNEGVWDWNVKTGELYCSPSWLESLGYSEADFRPNHEFWAGIIHPDDLPQVQEVLRAHMEGRRSVFEVENRLLCKSGRYRWNLARGKVVEQDDEGRPLRMVGSDTDISALKSAQEAIHSSEATLRSILRAAPAGIGISENRVLKQVNERMCEMLGYSMEELNGARSRILYASDEDFEKYGALHYTAIGKDGVAATEMRWIRKDGGMFDVLVNSAALNPDERSGPIAFTVLDITERKRAEEKLREARKAALEASRMKSEFLANMSHEIRTPMNAVIGLTQLMTDTGLDAEQREYMDTIRSSGQHLLDLINNILDFSKIESGKMTLDRIVFDIREVVADALKPLAFQAESNGVELVWEVGSKVSRSLEGDPGRLKQVLVNLVGNAVKFTDRGEIRIRIARKSRLGDEETLAFEVQDSGVGIPDGMQDEIFEAFKQADGSTTRRYGGTGLGLSISTKLVGLMGGRLRLHSEPGRGSRFFWDAVFGVSSADAVSDLAPVPGVVDAGGLRILLAEDNRVNRLVATRMLEKAGHAVVAVENGSLALDALEADRFDVVLMDIQMPVMDGLEAVRSLRDRESGNGDHVPVIALTAHALKGDQERCLDAGMDAYVPKPIRREELFDEIRRLVN